MSLNTNIDDNETILTPTNFMDSAVNLFVKAQKDRTNFKVGTEHELFAVDQEKKPLPYFGVNGIEAILRKMADMGDHLGETFVPILEHGHIIALHSTSCSITLEPGGQLELSGGQLKTAHENCREIHWFDDVLRAASAPHTEFIRAGFHPTAKRSDFSWVPKERYKIMRNYMPKKGALGLDMMLRTCTVQANLDYENEADMVKSVQTAFAVSPIVAGLFASSPFKEGLATGNLSERIYTWTDTDGDRCGYPAIVFEDSFGYEAWINFALDVPMYFVRRGDLYTDASGYSFREFIANGFNDQVATLRDFADHLTTIFTEVRLKPYIETRSADCGPMTNLCALPALWKGILYSQPARDQAELLMDHPSPAELVKFHRDAGRKGLRAKYRGTSLHHLAEQLLEISRAGLNELNLVNSDGNSENVLLQPLFNMVSKGETYADYLLKSLGANANQRG